MAIRSPKNNKPSKSTWSRRDVLKAGVATGATLATSTTLGQTTLVSGKNAKNSNETIIGEGDFRFRVEHNFLNLPDQYSWQTTHNVAVDSNNYVYVIHEGQNKKKDHPAIFIFDNKGEFVRAFGSELQGGGHGLEVRREGSEEFLYVTAYLGLKYFCKMTLTGEIIWKNFAPMESGLYAENEASNPSGEWGRNRFMPTNTAFLDDGSFLLADGYGAWCIHHYDTNGKYQKTLGEGGKKNGQFSLPHGLWVDKRASNTEIVVADRSNRRIQWITPEGKHVRTMDGFLRPANADIFEDLLVIPELEARISILDGNNKVVARLGDDTYWRRKVLDSETAMREHPDKWEDGQFIHPHDACFDKEGNLIVAEWVKTGRVTKLTRLS